MRLIIFTLSIVVSSFSLLQAQIVETAPEYNPSLRAKAYHDSQLFQTLTDDPDTLNLPFMDDFSYEGPVPSQANWCDANVFVNTTLSKNPPSVGLATFDGLDASGSPYGINGSSDFLTSNAFFLESYTTLDDVYLSFFYQAKGIGDRPESGDSLVLEFKDASDKWNVIASWDGISSSQPESFTPDFSFYSVAVSDEYLYDGFQFRLRNRSSGRGQVDLWHVDYVRLTDSFVPTVNSNDVAFTQSATTFLKNYTSMPWRHYAGFESEETTDAYQVNLFNHFPVVQEIQNRIVTITETTTNNMVMTTNYLTDNSQPIPLGNVNPGSHISASKTLDATNYSSFIGNMSSQFNGATDLIFETHLSFTQTGQDPAFQATFDNDVITRRTIFEDYFSYDDGTAESNVKAQNPGTDIAVKYHLNIADSLTAIRMHIPHIFDDASTQLFNIKVYLSLDNDPIYEANFQSPVYVDEFVAADTLQGLTTYILRDNLGNPTSILLPAGDFYIGWEQVTDTETPIPVGFDKNNIASGINNFYNAGGGWESFPSTLQGAIMIHPVLGDAVVFNTSVEDLDADTNFNIYPNPANEILVFNTKDGNDFEGGIEIFDIAGRRVWSSGFQEFVPVVSFGEGIYFIQLIEWETGIRFNKKIIIQH